MLGEFAESSMSCYYDLAAKECLAGTLEDLLQKRWLYLRAGTEGGQDVLVSSRVEGFWHKATKGKGD